MFKSARIKLTAWYLLLIMMVSLMFSGIIYRFMTLELDRFERARRIHILEQLQEGQMVPMPMGEQRFRTIIEDPELVVETKNRILLSLGILNIGILVIAGFSGYFLAGQTLKPIEQMTDEQNRFISDASHEIKTPLTSLKTAFEVYLRSEKKDHREALEIMQDSIEEVDKLHLLSENMLQLAHFEKPDQTAPKKIISIQSALESVFKKTKYLAQEKNITMKKDITDFHVKANENHLIDLLVIIIDNAIKYSPEGDTITISSKLKSTTGSISIADHGIGIAPDEIPHIFDRFFRSDKARTQSSKNGYGLGLSIAKKIAVSENIRIDVTSTSDVGTTFTLTFPHAS